MTPREEFLTKITDHVILSISAGMCVESEALRRVKEYVDAYTASKDARIVEFEKDAEKMREELCQIVRVTLFGKIQEIKRLRAGIQKQIEWARGESDWNKSNCVPYSIVGKLVELLKPSGEPLEVEPAPKAETQSRLEWKIKHAYGGDSQLFGYYECDPKEGHKYIVGDDSGDAVCSYLHDGKETDLGNFGDGKHTEGVAACEAHWQTILNAGEKTNG